jgi:hypothetical protein
MDVGGMTAIVGPNAPTTLIIPDAGVATPEMLIPLPGTDVGLPVE